MDFRTTPKNGMSSMKCMPFALTDRPKNLWSATVFRSREEGAAPMPDDFTTSAFFQTYAPRLRALISPRISPRLRRRFDEDDVISSAFRSFFLRPPSQISPAEDWNPWPLLVEIAIHKLARQVRRNMTQRRGIQQEIFGEEAVFDLSNSPAEEAELAEMLALVHDSLDAEERRVWQLRLDGYELLEIAKELAISERTVRRHLTHAKLKLSELLQAERHADRQQPVPRIESEKTAWTSYADFTLKRQIGVGAVGKVYQAVDKRTGETVAIKFLKKEFTRHSAARESILAEIEFGARLRHPSIVRIEGIGTTPNDGLFLVMEYLPGGNLAEVLRQQLPQRIVLKSWLLALIDGLAAAHDCGIMHCDLKPANVLFDAEFRPNLGDFGLAQWMTGTVGGIRGGTPAYLAPEMLDPTFGTPGPWTDIFGLGAIVREALTGWPPYLGSSTASILSEILRPDPIAWPISLSTEIPPEWQNFCHGCLAKSTSARWCSVSQLRQVVATLPVA